MSKLNLLMLNYEFPPIGGGAGNAHLCLLKQYAKSAVLSVDVLTSAPKPGFTTEQLADNVTIYKVGINKKNLHYWRKSEVICWLIKSQFHYKKLLHRNSYDLVHAFFGFPTGWLCYRTAKKIPYVISLRGSDVPGQHARLKFDYKIFAPVLKAIWKNAAALVACSEGLKNRALKFLPSVSIDVIPNGVDLEKFHPLDNKPKSDTLKLITVGRLSVTKRLDLLIDAVEILHKQGHKILLTIAGGGSLQDSLTQIVKQKNLTDSIEFTGRIEPQVMPQLYRQSDMFISATMQEGMSNAMLEATASALPIITTPCEGIEELIKDNGIVVEPQTPQAIANAVKSVISDKTVYEKMSAAARNLAQNFNWQTVAQDYLDLYKNILETGKNK